MRLVNRTELAELLGVSVRAITLWVAEGLPRVHDLGHRRYEARAVAGWLLGRQHRLFRFDVRDLELAARAREILEDGDDVDR